MRAPFLMLAAALWTAGAAAQELDPLLEDQRRQALGDRTTDLGGFQARGNVAAEPAQAQPDEGPCFDIRTIGIRGVSLLPKELLDALRAPYAARCLHVAEIRALMGAIDGAYADRGHITSKTYIPEQDLKSGALVLQVVEGRVEAIILQTPDGAVLDSDARAWRLATAFPAAEGAFFQLRDFEQGLDQMNRLKSVDARMTLRPGETDGGSVAVVTHAQDDRYRARMRYDTYGAKSTGDRRLSLDLDFDDIAGVNDEFKLGYSGSENTNALTARASAPYGYWTLSADAAYSEYLTPLNTVSELFGRSLSGEFKAQYMAFRDQTSTLELSAAMGVRRSERFINDVALTPQNLTTLTLGGRYLTVGAAARQSFSASVVSGVEWFGADRQGAPDAPQPQFVKLALGWQRQAAIKGLGSLVTDAQAQLSPDSLYGAEQMSVGSLSTVRGYRESAAAGDSGAYIRNDLYLDSDLWSWILPDGLKAEAGRRAQVNLFLDAGMTRDHARARTDYAAGAGVGFAFYHERFTVAGQFAAPLMRDNRAIFDEIVFDISVDMKLW